MADTNKQIEHRIHQACEKALLQSRPNYAQIVREFDVPYRRLLRRVQGTNSLFEREPNGCKLNSIQEEALCHWIDYHNKLGLSVKHSEIATAALSILQEIEPDTAIISDKWLKYFLDRHPEYCVHRRKSLDIERLRVYTKKSMEEWFKSL
jgi:hypothetical protein